MRQGQVRIVQVELQLMTGLTIRFIRNAFHETAFDLDLVAVSAVEFLPGFIDRRNISLEMTAMIKSQNVVNRIAGKIRIGIANVVWISRFGNIDPELGMIIPKRLENPGITLRRAA